EKVWSMPVPVEAAVGSARVYARPMTVPPAASRAIVYGRRLVHFTLKVEGVATAGAPWKEVYVKATSVGAAVSEHDEVRFTVTLKFCGPTVAALARVAAPRNETRAAALAMRFIFAAPYY